MRFLGSNATAHGFLIFAASQQLILLPRLIYSGIVTGNITEQKLYYPIACAVPFGHNLHFILSVTNYLVGFVFGNNMFWASIVSFVVLLHS